MLDHSSLEALALRVESGSGKDRRIDYELFALFADSYDLNFWDPEDGHHFTSSLDAVKALIEAKLPGWFWRVGFGSHAGPWAHLNRLHPDSCLPGDEATSYAASPERALLAASLRALAQKEEG